MNESFKSYLPPDRAIQPEQTASPVEPIYDTWELKKDAGTWCIVPVFDFLSLSTSDVNAWSARVVTGTLEAFGGLARAWWVEFDTSYREIIEGVRLEWKPGKSYEKYTQDVLRAIQEFPASIYRLKMGVDLYVYIRTEQSPDTPVRAWVRHLGYFVFWGGPEVKEPYLCFEINHTLFSPESMYGDDNRELYLLNQPLLEQALREWERRVGSIRDVEGISGIYEYGFSTEV